MELQIRFSLQTTFTKNCQLAYKLLTVLGENVYEKLKPPAIILQINKIDLGHIL